MGSTRKKVSIKNKSNGHHYKQQNRGYSFKTWLEYARECTLVEISFGELVQSDVILEDKCVILEEHKLEDEMISEE